MSYLGTDAAGVKRWQCDNCERHSAWTDSWVWFGSLRDADDLGNNVPVFCSKVCGEAKGLKDQPTPPRKKRKDHLYALTKAQLISLLKTGAKP